MPELPEVEANRRLLARAFAGRRLVAVAVPDPTSVRLAMSTRTDRGHPGVEVALGRLVGHTADAPVRVGKRLGWSFGDHAILAHLGMTGRWVIAASDAPPPRWAKVGLSFDDGRTAWFVDPRRFGCVVPLPTAALDAALRDGLGPDALDAPLDGPALAARFATPRAIKVALLDQARLAGLGNIHAVEALWRAHVHPDARCTDLTAADWARLASAIEAQLHHGLALTEADAIAYLSDGGDQVNPFEVYGRAGEPCRACGDRIHSEVRGGRSTFWCPSCQPARGKAAAGGSTPRRDGGRKTR